MDNIIEISGKFAKAKVFTDIIDEEAFKLITNFLNHPASKGQKIRIMPDVHAAKGVVVGFTSTLNGEYIIPNVIGADIGCGVIGINIGRELPELKEIDDFIKENIKTKANDSNNLNNLRKQLPKDFVKEIKKVARNIGASEGEFLEVIGTLGSGNHFIEIDKSMETGEYWLVIHTGSRSFGLKVATYYQKMAEKEYDESRGKKGEYKFFKDLAYLKERAREAYIRDMEIAQRYASMNRKLLLDAIIKKFGLEKKEVVESIHNYIDFEYKIVRKGAISAQKGERVIIPMNMVWGIVIGEGKGNPDWNFSAPHGAGRIMTRREAKEKLNVEDFRRKMKESGVYSTSIDDTTIDEAPDVYKNPEIVVEYLKATVDIKERLKPVYNFKE